MKISRNTILLRRWRIPALGLLVLSALLFGCRRWPDNSTPLEPPEAEGSYVGSGALGGSAANVLMGISGPDTSGQLTGAIRYRSQVITFDDIYRIKDTDTLWFRYRRDNVAYRAWALLGGNGLAVHFVEPDALPVFRLNREIAGYNMSGLWNGQMTSNALQEQSAATLSMDQQGQSFYGAAETVFLQSARFDLDNGVANGSGFQLTGDYRIGPSDYSTLFVGTYVARDTVLGNWDAGENGAVDRGEFFFYRSFD
jgi:hypothetical protein